MAGQRHLLTTPTQRSRLTQAVTLGPSALVGQTSVAQTIVDELCWSWRVASLHSCVYSHNVWPPEQVGPSSNSLDTRAAGRQPVACRQPSLTARRAMPHVLALALL